MTMTVDARETFKREWRSGVPSACGYFLVTWRRGPPVAGSPGLIGDLLVSELWYDQGCWYTTRFYCEPRHSWNPSDPAREINGAVVAWMPMPPALEYR